MMLPYASEARIEKEKLLDYLLSPNHPKGRPKTEFFASFGLDAASWETLRAALLKHAVTYEVTRTVESPYGMQYVMEDQIETPDGRNPLIRTVWMISEENPRPRLITAYPL